MAKIYSQLISAQVENRSSDYSAGCKGRLWLNTATSLFKVDDGTNISPLVTLDTSAASGTVPTANGSGNFSWSAPSSAPDSSQEVSNLGLATSVATNALTISLKGKNGSDPAGGNVVKIGFRNATVTTGTYNQRTATAATSIVVTATATLGHVASKDEYIYVYAIDNAGTIELAVSSTRLPDEGSVVSTTIMSAAATSKIVIYSTTARASVPVRLIGRIKSNQGTAGTWASAMSEVSVLRFNREKQNHSSVVGDTPVGHGATSTTIRRFTSANTITIGTGMTFSDNANTGSLITINEDGIYFFNYWDNFNSASAWNMGISVNSAQVTTSISGITKANRIAMTSGSGAGTILHTTACRRLFVGDQVRFHTDGQPDGVAVYEQFTAIKIAD